MNLLVKPIEGGFESFRVTRKLSSQGHDADRNCPAAGASSLLLVRSKVKGIKNKFAERSSIPQLIAESREEAN
jgi:hypothetical protein